MQSLTTFEQLEVFAKSRTRFSAPAEQEDDFISQYIYALNKRGYQEDEQRFEDYLEYVERAPKKAASFIKRHPILPAVIALREEIAKKYFPYDKRDSIQ